MAKGSRHSVFASFGLVYRIYGLYGDTLRHIQRCPGPPMNGSKNLPSLIQSRSLIFRKNAFMNLDLRRLVLAAAKTGQSLTDPTVDPSILQELLVFMSAVRHLSQ